MAVRALTGSLLCKDNRAHCRMGDVAGVYKVEPEESVFWSYLGGFDKKRAHMRGCNPRRLKHSDSGLHKAAELQPANYQD